MTDITDDGIRDGGIGGEGIDGAATAAEASGLAELRNPVRAGRAELADPAELADGLPSWRVLWLVARREVITRLRSKAFRIMTGLLVLGIVLGIGATAMFGGSSPSKVGFTVADAADAAVFRAAAASLGADVRVETTTDAADGERLVRAGDLDAAVTSTPAGGYRVVVGDTLSDQLRGLLGAVARQQVLDEQITRLGGDRSSIDAAVAAAGVDVVALHPTSPRDGGRIALGVITGVLIYVALVFFGPAVAQGVVEEKSSRVVELLLATVRPWQLMAGKVLGIGVIGLGQLLLIAVVGVGLAIPAGALDLPASIAAGSAAWALLWFLLGFALYALLFAAAGALVSRQEDAGGVTSPIIMMIIIPYIIGISVLPGNPDSTLLAVLSVLPMSAPLVMPMLIAVGSAPGWQIALAVVLTVLTIVVLVRLTGRIYAGAVRRTGTRVRLRDALRAP